MTKIEGTTESLGWSGWRDESSNDWRKIRSNSADVKWRGGSFLMLLKYLLIYVYKTSIYLHYKYICYRLSNSRFKSQGLTVEWRERGVKRKLQNLSYESFSIPPMEHEYSLLIDLFVTSRKLYENNSIITASIVCTALWDHHIAPQGPAQTDRVSWSLFSSLRPLLGLYFFELNVTLVACKWPTI